MTQTINYNGPVFNSFKPTAQVTGLSICYLRKRVAAGEIKYIKAGNKILINIPALLQQLDRESAGV